MVRSAGYSEKLKDQWEEEEEDKIHNNNNNHKGMSAVARRNGKGGRERWSGGGNREPDGKHKSFTPQEEELVIQLHAAIGSRWPIIAQQLPGRTENDVKTLWNSKLRKKLSAMGIDPVTHKPFSQILADYGSIGAFPKARTRFASLSRDLKNATLMRQSNTYQFSPLDNAESEQAPEPMDQHYSLDLYSQLRAVNLVADASNPAKNEQIAQCYYMPECGLPADISGPGFSWSDFLLEDEFLPVPVHENMAPGDKGAVVVECDGITEQSYVPVGVVERENYEDTGSDILNNGFELGSCSESSSFVEAMLESQDEMFAQLSGFFGEPFYY
ncbi:transcription factor MYB35-like isoform X2 [Andrographis paniculata]|uniref:transcription factor MYB35-like isoform X2 n=1 Tax=Andrographis paniculata TaxID=175694 RepID=UPI0021E8D88D|nr:transcription factor MYB35-like isoform X2 [Andrographis paniculata]